MAQRSTLGARISPLLRQLVAATLSAQKTDFSVRSEEEYKQDSLTVGAVCCSYVPTDAFSKEAPSAAAAVAAAVAVANAKNKAVVDLKSEA